MLRQSVPGNQKRETYSLDARKILFHLLSGREVPPILTRDHADHIE